MSENTLSIRAVSLKALLSVLEAAAANPGRGAEEISAFAGYNPRTTREALTVLDALGLVTANANGRFHCRANSVRRGVSEDEGQIVLRMALLTYRPFEALCEGLALNETVDVAIRRASVLLGLEQSERSKFEVLIKWGRELGLLDDNQGHGFRLAKEIDVKAQESLTLVKPEDIESIAKARLFNARRLGRTANNFLDEIDRGLLAEALLSLQTNPDRAAERAGQALEDFLRQVAVDKGYGPDAKNCNGPTQLANMMAAKGLIHNHHQKMVDAVASFRTATAHQKDKKTLTPWRITAEGAFSAVLISLTAIRSIYDFIYSRSQTL